MTKKKEQKQRKPKLQTKVTIDKSLARALSLTIGKEMVSYTTGGIYFNTKEKELVATDGKVLFVIKSKPMGLFSTMLNLEEGLYDIIGNILIKNDMNRKEIRFPNYKSIISVKPKEICNGNILHGLLDCIIKNQIHLDVWKFAPILKILDKVSDDWRFFNNSSTESIIIETENSNYIIKYVMMPWPRPFTHMVKE